jgi:hypothetical protein
VVVWGGTKEVRKNETKNGLKQIKEFCKKNNHTNIIQLCVPHRDDLHINSCVNKEVKVFNRRLSKLMIFDHTVLLQIDSNREMFTKHGLHMNDKGKELAAIKIASTMKYIFQEKIKEPICLTWKEDDVKKLQENHNTQAYEEEKK